VFKIFVRKDNFITMFYYAYVFNII